MCCFRCPTSPNESPHSAHLWTFSQVWVTMCILKWCARLNDFSHSEQVWVFSPLWVSMCLFRFPVLPNDFCHWTHVYVFSLLWVAMCIFLPLLWVTMWLLSSAQPDEILHSEQMCIKSPLWALWAYDSPFCFSLEWIGNNHYSGVCLAELLLYLFHWDSACRSRGGEFSLE